MPMTSPDSSILVQAKAMIWVDVSHSVWYHVILLFSLKQNNNFCCKASFHQILSWLLLVWGKCCSKLISNTRWCMSVGIPFDFNWVYMHFKMHRMIESCKSLSYSKKYCSVLEKIAILQKLWCLWKHPMTTCWKVNKKGGFHTGMLKFENKAPKNQQYIQQMLCKQPL